MRKNILLIMLAAIGATSCYYDNAEELYQQEPCDVSAVTYSQDVSVIINNNCLSCHSGPNAEANLDLSTYGTVSANAAVIKVRINLPAGDPGVMPPTGPMSPCNMNKVTTWIDQGAINN